MKHSFQCYMISKSLCLTSLTSYSFLCFSFVANPSRLGHTSDKLPKQGLEHEISDFYFNRTLSAITEKGFNAVQTMLMTEHYETAASLTNYNYYNVDPFYPWTNGLNI